MTGREQTKSARTSNRGVAERAAERWERELLANHAPQDLSWESFRVRFENEHSGRLSRASQISYGTALNWFEKLVGEPLRLSAVNASVVSQFQSKLREQGMAERSVVTHLTHLRAALRWAASVGMIPYAPGFKLPKLTKRKLARGRPLTEPEFKRLLAAIPGVVGQENAAEWERLLRGLWLGGFRLAEALRLSWTSPPVQVDLDGGAYPRILWFAEGHKARRDEVTPLTPDFAAFLRRTPKRLRTGPVFAPEYPRRAVTRVWASKVISAIGRASGVTVNDAGKPASAHDLRRSFGTRWSTRVRPATLQALMRHSTMETTLRYYVDLDSEDVGGELWNVPANVPTSGVTSERPAVRHRKNVEKNGRVTK